MTQAHKDPPAIPGVHLVKTTTREEDSLASDVVDILREGLRGGMDCDVGGVEETYRTTLEQDEARRTEHEFFRAIADRLKLHCSAWANGKRGVACGDLGDRDGWRFGLYDKEGRLFEIEVRFSEIHAISAMQRTATISNFEHTLDRIVAKFQEARRVYFVRRDGVEIH
jgi:hypothetical protein